MLDTTGLDFDGCNAILYDEEGKQLAIVKIEKYDGSENTIKVFADPALLVGALCDVLILTAPVPYTYKGRIHDLGHYKLIRLFKGKSMCKRREVRYSVDLPASIDGLIYDDRIYPLQKKLDARLINISKSGVRFRTDYNALTVGGRVRMRMKVGDDEKSLTADVVFRTDNPPDCSEFGCKLVS